MSAIFVALFAAALGLGFRYGLTAHLALVEEAQIAWNVWGPSRILASSLTRLAAQDSLPAPGKRPTDAIFSAGVDLTF